MRDEEVYSRLLTIICLQKVHTAHSAGKLDLCSLRRRPTHSEQLGIYLVLLSFVIGWPAVAFFCMLSAYPKQPRFLIIGGPLTHGIFYVLFLIGAYISGKEYVVVLAKWSIIKAFEKLSAGGQHQSADVMNIE